MGCTTMDLNDKEVDLIEALRKLEISDSGPSFDDPQKLKSTVNLIAYSGDRSLDLHSVDASNIIFECAQVGVKIRRKLLADEDLQKQIEEPQEILNNCKASPDKDSEPINWNDIMEELPSYVRSVTFTITEEDMTPTRRKELDRHFSGFAVQIIPDVITPAPTDMPKGIKRAIFQVGHRETDIDLTREGNVLDQYPRASVQYDLSPLSSISSPESNTHRSPQYEGEHHDQNSDALGSIQHKAPVNPSSNLPIKLPEPTSSSQNVHLKKKERPVGKPSTKIISSETIPTIAHDIGLTLDRPGFICFMFARWSKTKRIPSYCNKLKNCRIDEYYNDLIDLYIIARLCESELLQYALLLEFQSTHFQNDGTIPNFQTVFKLFLYLDGHPPLCDWVVLVYAFLWHTPQHEYEEFCTYYPGLHTPTLVRFLFMIASERCTLPSGGDHPVQLRWCKFHEHRPGSYEEHRCQTTRNKNVANFNYFQELFEQATLERATEAIEELGGRVTMSTAGQKSAKKARKPVKRKGVAVIQSPEKRRRRTVIF